MTSRSEVEVLISVSPVPELGSNIYSNEGPLIHQVGGHRAFGGSLISQAIIAATATVPAGFVVYSSQSSFLRPVDSRQKVNYRVDHAAEGRTFATRIVHATQTARGPSLYTAIISFQKYGSVAASGRALTYADPMPMVSSSLRPLDLPKLELRELGFQAAKSASSPAVLIDDEPFDWRPLPLKQAQDPSQIRAHGFVRSKPLSGEAHAVHLGSLAFLSDHSLLEMALFANLETIDEKLQRLIMNTTLTHHVSFHSPSARADEWMLCESRTSWGADGRIFVHHKYWKFETGQLLVSCTQEALIGPEQPRL